MTKLKLSHDNFSKFIKRPDYFNIIFGANFKEIDLTAYDLKSTQIQICPRCMKHPG